MEDDLHFLVSYYADGTWLQFDEHVEAPPVIGHGVHLEGVFYRIVDVWHDREKHAPADWGLVVFLEQVDTADVFLQVDAHYYASNGDK